MDAATERSDSRADSPGTKAGCRQTGNREGANEHGAGVDVAAAEQLGRGQQGQERGVEEAFWLEPSDRNSAGLHFRGWSIAC